MADTSGTHYTDDEPTRDSNALLVKSPRSMYNDYVSSNTLSQKKDLPRIALDDPHYSSTVMMLKKTRQEVEDYTADLSVINTIVDLPTSEDVRRTVAKIFADPRNAEAISESEWRKREQQYQHNRERFGEKMAEHVATEKNLMTQELHKLNE
jgi:hypothetical protein